MTSDSDEKPFGGAISDFFANAAPKDVREAIENAGRKDIIAPGYPYEKRLGAKAYAKRFAALQIELVRMQHGLRDAGGRLVVVFEGRDAAGKGGSIKRLTENINPRGARVVALTAPSDAERGEWYFQRYIRHLPTAGEIALFDRSWYNRAVVERIFGFSTEAQRERFFHQTPPFETALVEDGVTLIKIWLTISRAEQLRRFLARESDPLKQWKLSRIDVDSLSRWDEYSRAIADMFARTHHAAAPWTVIRADDKRRARLEVMRRVLGAVDYPGKRPESVGAPDPAITGDPLSVPIR